MTEFDNYFERLLTKLSKLKVLSVQELDFELMDLLIKMNSVRELYVFTKTGSCFDEYNLTPYDNYTNLKSLKVLANHRVDKRIITWN